MNIDEIVAVAKNPEVKKLAAACHDELKLLAAEKTAHDYVLEAVSVVELEERGISLDTIIFELQCRQYEYELARKQLIGFRTEYGAGIYGNA